MRFVPREAYSVSFRSYAHQVNTLKGKDIPSQACIGLFVKGDKPLEMFVLLCWNAFYNLKRSAIRRLAASEGLHTDGNLTLFLLLFFVIQTVLKLEDEEVLAVIALRLGEDEAEFAYNEALFEVDGALGVLDPDDHKKALKDNKEKEKEKEVRRGFVHEYHRKKTECENKKKSTAAGSGGDGGKKGGDGGKAPKGKEPVMPSTIPQKEAKKYLPPGTYIWRAVVRCEWCGHCAPYKRCSHSWLVYGEYGSMIMTIKKLWDQYCELNATDFMEVCPFAAWLLDQV